MYTPRRLYQYQRRHQNSVQIQKLPQIPLLDPSKQFAKNLKSQNTFLLSKIGVNKNKFVNFRLKIRQEAQRQHRQNSQKRMRKGLKIPLLSYNSKQHSPLKQMMAKHQHQLLVSRSKWLDISTPSIGTYDTTSLQKMKFKKSQCAIMGNALRKELFNLR